MSNATPKAPGSGLIPDISRRSLDLGGARRPQGREGEESKKLLVGKEISLSGEITACDTLVVEGSVEATLENSHRIEIAEGGRFKGKVAIHEAEIAGSFEGDLTVRDKLLIRSTGIITGKVIFGSLEVEHGGRIKGEISPVDHASEGAV